jgi:hypothetical protein
MSEKISSTCRRAITDFELTLSSTGLSNLAAPKLRNDFTFIVGEDSHKCPWFVADFLSPKIAQLHFTDSSIDEFVIETEDTEKQFGEFLAFGRGSSVRVMESNLSFLVSIACELSNFELYFALLDHFSENVAISTLCEHFRSFSVLDCLPVHAVQYLASHFFEIPVLFLNELPFTILVQILSSECLKIISEDSLFEFILSNAAGHIEYLELFEFVQFEFLTSTEINKFILWSFDHLGDLNFTLSFWKRIAKRLSLDVSPKSENDERHCLSFPLRPDYPLEGIIAFLTRKHWANVATTHIVEVSASGVASTNYAHYAVDLNNDCHFQSPNELNQWLKLDFKDKRVKLTHYSISGCKHDPFMPSWVIEGSMDGDDNNWAVLDCRTDNTEIDSRHPLGTFNVGESAFYRFIRVRGTDQRPNNTHYLRISKFELFGFLTT